MGFMKHVFIWISIATLSAISGCNNSKNASVTTKFSVSRKLAVVSAAYLANEKAGGNKSSHGISIEFAKNGSGVAYIEPYDGKFRVVHNDKPGKNYFGISELSISNDGKRIAYVASIDGNTNIIVVDGREGYPFGENDNHWFTPDGTQHVSTVTKSGIRFLVIDGNLIQKYRIEQGPVLSADSHSMAFSVLSPDNSSKTLIISDMKMQSAITLNSCGEFIFPNDESSRIAVGCSSAGKKSVKVIDFTTRSEISDSTYDGLISHMKFTADSRSLMYTYVKNESNRYVVYKGKEELIPSGDEFLSDPLLFSEPESVGIIIGDVYNARLYRAFQHQKKVEKRYGYTSDFTVSRDGRHYAFIAVNHNEEQQYIVVEGNEGTKFDKIVSPLFTLDGKFLIYRARQRTKRFLVISDLKGKIVRQHKEYDMVFQPVFSTDGKSVSYGVLDGNELWWKVEKL